VVDGHGPARPYIPSYFFCAGIQSQKVLCRGVRFIRSERLQGSSLPFGAVLRVSRKLPVDGRLPRRIRSRAFPPDEPLLPQQRDEASLFEMMVSGQCIPNAMLLHDDEGNAIGQGPLLVGASIVEFETSLK
jgi:hypothetical protein